MNSFIKGAGIGLVGLGLICAAAPTFSQAEVREPGKPKMEDQGQLLQGNHAALGFVETVTADHIKVDVGTVQPRFLPLEPARQKHFADLKPGDVLIIVLNDQNLIVDYHPVEESSAQSHMEHRVVAGQIAQNLAIGHDRAVIRMKDGKEESHAIRSQARSKLASIPVGVDALFLLDETNQIADATFASREALHKAQESSQNKSSLKGAQRQVEGTVAQTLTADQITIRMPDGAEVRYEVRPLIHDKVGKLSKGTSVILLVDPSEKVFDIAVPPQPSTNSQQGTR